MTRFLVAAVLAVCVSASYASPPSWGSWRSIGECTCDSRGVGYEVWRRDCFDDCTVPYEESRRPCECGPVLTAGEIAGIAVGSVVTLILLICLICWCCCCMCGGAMCGEECDGGCYGDGSRGGCMGCMGCGGCGRWDSEEDLYRGRGRKVPMMTQVQAPMQAQPQQIVVTAAQVRPQAQYAAVNFGAAVVQQAPAQTYYVG